MLGAPLGQFEIVDADQQGPRPAHRAEDEGEGEEEPEVAPQAHRLKHRAGEVADYGEGSEGEEASGCEVEGDGDDVVEEFLHKACR